MLLSCGCCTECRGTTLRHHCTFLTHPPRCMLALQFLNIEQNFVIQNYSTPIVFSAFYVSGQLMFF